MNGYSFKLFLLFLCLQLDGMEATEDGRSKRGAAGGHGPHVISPTQLTADDQQFVATFHNLKRSLVKPPATNMLKMVYDQSLADVAMNYSRNCVYEHNESPGSATYPYAGENLYVSTKIFTNLSQALEASIQLWFDEGQDFKYLTNSCRSGKVCGHYTQVVWAETRAVGCGVTTCGNLRFKGQARPRSQLVVCNYGPGGNYRGEKPYRTGTSCSACPANKECVCESIPDQDTPNDDDDESDGPKPTPGNAMSYRSTSLIWISALLQAVFLFTNI